MSPHSPPCFLLLLLGSLAVSRGAVELVSDFGNGSSIYGLALVKERLHVVRDDEAMVQVYADDFTKLQSLQATNQSGIYDLAHLPKADLLVMLNWFDGKNVILMNLAPPYNVIKWNFTDHDTVAALSITSPDELIVITESATKTLKVFTKEGTLVREIKLKTQMSPRQAIRTLDNLYAVSFGYERMEAHVICKFNVLGYVHGACFGGRPGNSDRQVDVPARMLNAADGGLLVADMANKRVIKVNKELDRAEVLVHEGLDQPYRILHDPAHKLLYVANNVLDPVTKYSVYGNVHAYRLDF